MLAVRGLCRSHRRALSAGMPGVIPFLLDFLSAYRLTRLITADTILDGPRDALVRWAYERQGRGDDGPSMPSVPGAWSGWAMDDDRAPKLATLATCRWCASMHLALFVVFARRRFPRQWAPIAEALALSAGAALIAGLED